MPNFKLPFRVSEHMRDNAIRRAQRARDLAMQGFPLTSSQIQHAGVGLSEEQIDVLKGYIKEGVKTIERHQELRISLLRDHGFPELKRSVVLRLKLPQWIVVGRGTQWGVSTMKDFTMDDAHYLTPHFNNLSNEDRARLLKWVSDALLQERMHEIVKGLANQILPGCETMAHLHARWPLMTTMLDPKQVHGSMRSQREQLEQWVEKLRHPPVHMRRYKPSAQWAEAFANLIKVADIQILNGQMLPALVSENAREHVIATIEHWERLTGDPTFPIDLPAPPA